MLIGAWNPTLWPIWGPTHFRYCTGEVGHNCWDDYPTGKNVPRLNHTHLETCICSEALPTEYHHYNNVTNWDRARQVFCNGLIQQFDADHPFPDELKPVLELTYTASCHTWGACYDGAADSSYGVGPTGNLTVEYLWSDAWRAARSPCVAAPSGHDGCGEDAGAEDAARASSPFEAQPDGSKFDPAAVKRLFQQLQAGLHMYHQGGLMLQEWYKPAVGTQAHAAMVTAMTKKFAAAFVHGGPFVIGSVGDSTLAGADNCYFDAWTNGLQRQLTPLFGAGHVQLDVRNGGHNGGLPTDYQLACIRSIAGPDVDIILHQAPFVKSHGPFVEDMVRRALVENGAIVQSCNDHGEEFLAMYAPYGYSTGSLVEGQARKQHWYPSQGKSNWGRVGDGICHTNFTRSGSLAVAQRNWHPGPLGHQQQQDAYVYQWSVAIINALVEIEAAVEDGLSLAQMKARWPRRTPVDPGSLPPPYFCSEAETARMEKDHPGLGRMLCSPNGPATKGLATCLTDMTPWHDAAWEDVVVTGDDRPAWDSHNMNTTKPLFKSWGPNSNDFGGCTDREDRCRPSCNASKFAEQCRVYNEESPKIIHHWGDEFGDQVTMERGRARAACVHKDGGMTMQFGRADDGSASGATDGGRGWMTLKLRKGTMHFGIISVCMKCGAMGGRRIFNHSLGAPTIMIKAKGVLRTIDVAPLNIEEPGTPKARNEYGLEGCTKLCDTLPADALAEDVLLGILPPAIPAYDGNHWVTSMCEINYLYAN